MRKFSGAIRFMCLESQTLAKKQSRFKAELPDGRYFTGLAGISTCRVWSSINDKLSRA